MFWGVDISEAVFGVGGADLYSESCGVIVHYHNMVQCINEYSFE